MNPIDLLRNPWRALSRVEKKVPESATLIPRVGTDVQGDIKDFSPAKIDSLPVKIRFRGHAGDLGHLSVGYLRISGSDDRKYSRAGIKLKLDHVEFYKDRGVTRIALATAWKPLDASIGVGHYYVEFDVWTSPRWNRVVRMVRYNCYDPQGKAAPTMPTIELKIAQIRVGQTYEFLIPFGQTFHEVFPDAEAVLDDVYLVLNKQDRRSDFLIEMELGSITLD
ncbi:MAG: hypothetical protein A4E32_01963 [Methanomassiliicoccales archaeon PtaU1.Bin124]|nr:MAG: hypothetical protein A4E32_01963 [Methanomassiliicoccales archaeon PtaU1.Bin124]